MTDSECQSRSTAAIQFMLECSKGDARAAAFGGSVPEPPASAMAEIKIPFSAPQKAERPAVKSLVVGSKAASPFKKIKLVRNSTLTTAATIKD